MGTKYTKEALVKNGGSRSWVTIIDTITAAGKYLNPGIIFKGKELQGQWFLREFKTICDWKYICSENGWTNNAIAVEWLKDVFLPQINAIRNNDNGRVILLALFPPALVPKC
jgi:hypothetical protein